jgi:hypothetical protein
MMEAVSTLKRWPASTKLHGPITQKAVIFTVMMDTVHSVSDKYLIHKYFYSWQYSHLEVIGCHYTGGCFTDLQEQRQWLG